MIGKTSLKVDAVGDMYASWKLWDVDQRIYAPPDASGVMLTPAAVECFSGAGLGRNAALAFRSLGHLLDCSYCLGTLP